MSNSLSTQAPRSPAAPNPQGWASGRFSLRVHGFGPEYERPVEIRRPYCVLGRAPDCDIVLDDPAVEPVHVYLHLDRRGLYAVDLATPAGSRIGPFGEPCAWLRPGDFLEVAGCYLFEIAGVQLDDPDPAGPGTADPLEDVVTGLELSLHPLADPAAHTPPLILRSQLVFVGRSEICGIRVEDAQVAPVQCVFVNTGNAVHLIDLSGRNTRLNDQTLGAPTQLRDGDILEIGAARCECRISEAASGEWRVARESEAASSERRVGNENSSSLGTQHSALSTHEVASEDSSSLITHHSSLITQDNAQLPTVAWMLGALQNTHEELLRCQESFHHEILRAIRKIQRQQSTVHSMQLERLEHLSHEVALLRDEVRRRYGANAPLPRAEPPRALPPGGSPLPQTGNLIDGTNAWLSRRIHEINQENQAARRAVMKK